MNPRLRLPTMLVSFAVPLVLLWEPLRHWVEATMFRHMLLVIPLLLAAGWYSLGIMGADAIRAFSRWNALGFPGLLCVSSVLAVWMIPNAMDMAASDLKVDVAKNLSVFVAGMMLALSCAQAGLVIQLFFIGNWLCMTIFVGVLFQSLPTQLCNLYGVGDQVRTGQGLVVYAVIVGTAWGWWAWQQYSCGLEVSRDPAYRDTMEKV